MGKIRDRRILKFALLNLELAVSDIKYALESNQEINPHRVWIIEGDILDGLARVQEFLKLNPLGGAALYHKQLIEKRVADAKRKKKK